MVYQYGDNEYRTPIATFTTINDMVQPFILAVSTVTSNTATVSWEGYAKAYNLRYRKNEGEVQVTLSVPEAIWERDWGYQMLLDANHDAYDTVIPNFVTLANPGDVPDATYAEFEYKAGQRHHRR